MSYFENRILLKPALGAVAGVARFITGHEHTQLNRVCHFLFFGAFIASKRSNFPELINRVTDEVLLTETALWSIFFLTDIITALKRSPSNLYLLLLQML